MDKIEWYREVLELEPSSKLFFPLARLLVEDGQPEAALETLRRGLERHPEFLEARLFYIEQLYHHGQPKACVAEVTELGQLFASYPGFWQAWAASMLGSGCGDVATALRFLAASFASRPLNLNLHAGGPEQRSAARQGPGRPGRHGARGCGCAGT